jgi:hypothetical protein
LREAIERRSGKDENAWKMKAGLWRNGKSKLTIPIHSLKVYSPFSRTSEEYQGINAPLIGPIMILTCLVTSARHVDSRGAPLKA